MVTLIRLSLASGGMSKQRGHQLEEKIDYEGSASGYITELSHLQTTSLIFFFSYSRCDYRHTGGKTSLPHALSYKRSFFYESINIRRCRQSMFTEVQVVLF